jgi:cysteinyl-tRNA synthetase
MSLDLLGDGFDIHAGGQDLAFPHHENERAQAVVTGHRFARHWVHNGFVEVGGEKMSKSLGNFTNLLDLIDDADPRAYRLLVLQSHYRAPIEVTKTTVDQAVATLQRLDGFARRFAGAKGDEPDAELLAKFRERMDDDLDTPAAMALLFEARARADTGDDQAAAAAAFVMAGAVGLVLNTEVGEVSDEALALARRRDEARSAQEWATADGLRSEIQAMGYEVEDTPTGTVVRPI